jgi:uncharacterized protein
MKNLFILAISFYQILISPLIKTAVGTGKVCRFSPTCSEYSKQVIIQNGVFSGMKKTFKRVLSCQPFAAA